MSSTPVRLRAIFTRRESIMMRWLVLTALLFPMLAAAQVVRIHGSNTIGERLAPALAEAWLRAEGFETIERSVPATNEVTLRGVQGAQTLTIEIRAHGTSTGFASLRAGTADIAMASRQVSADEVTQAAALGRLDSPEQEAVIALDGVAAIVHPDNPLRQLRIDQLRAVFSGAVRDWSAVGGRVAPIALHARDERSGTWETFRTLVLADAALAASARRYESTQALAAAVAADPQAIGFVSLTGVGDARALAIADAPRAVPPEGFTVAVEDYPLSRRLFLYAPADAKPESAALVEFALSAEGQRVVEHAGFVAQDVRPYRVEVHRDAPHEYLALVRDAQRLSVNFRFGAGSRLLDGKMLRDVERLAAYMRDPANRRRDLMLLGFADASEASPYLAVTLSNDRVDLVAGLLEDRGVAASRSRGMGGAAPIASNDTSQGRMRNRRVEVWVR
jgi:phosphate transport system substrate-binding protein